MRVVVTGGAGFIGSHIVDALAARNDEPIVLDDLSSGRAANISVGVDFITCDIALFETADRIADLRPDVVIHAAAQASVPRSMADPERDRAVNLLGTAHVIEGARRGGAGRVVFLSTGGGIYGETAEPATEETLPRPKAYYSVHKYAAERYLELSGLGYGIARLANVYGPRQQSDLEGGVVAIFAERLARGEPITIYGSGEQSRDLVHVRDVAEAILLTVDSDQNSMWNVGTGEATTINALVSLMETAIAQAAEVRHEDARIGDVFGSCLSPVKLRRELGWRPQIALADGVRMLRDR